MKQKRVSFKVAKALKEAGYPQSPNASEYWYVTEHSEPIFDEPYKDAGTLVDDWDFATNMVSAPTYLDVWLRLWREKGIRIQVISKEELIISKDSGITYKREYPEEAIIAAIEYFVDNDLIK